MIRNPYIAGNPVYGENFYGRSRIIQDILTGPRNYLWILALRRTGKTSLLRQIDYLVNTEKEYSSQYGSLFLNFSGYDCFDSLAQPLRLAIGLKKNIFEKFGIHYEDIIKKDFFNILETVLVKLKEHKINLLLLCDESESLVGIGKKEPDMLKKLKGMLEMEKSVRMVIVGTNRLFKMLPEFFENFGNPLYLANLEDSETEDLIKQTKAGIEVEFLQDDGKIIKTIQKTTGNHPLQVQTLCYHVFPQNKVNNVIDGLIKDDIFGKSFELMLGYLPISERNILHCIFDHDGLNKNELLDFASKNYKLSPFEIRCYLWNLIELGFVRKKKDSLLISSYFFKRWFEKNKTKVFSTEYLALKRPKIEDKDILNTYQRLNINSHQAA